VPSYATKHQQHRQQYQSNRSRNAFAESSPARVTSFQSSRRNQSVPALTEWDHDTQHAQEFKKRYEIRRGSSLRTYASAYDSQMQGGVKTGHEPDENDPIPRAIDRSCAPLTFKAQPKFANRMQSSLISTVDGYMPSSDRVTEADFRVEQPQSYITRPVTTEEFEVPALPPVSPSLVRRPRDRVPFGTEADVQSLSPKATSPHDPVVTRYEQLVQHARILKPSSLHMPPSAANSHGMSFRRSGPPAATAASHSFQRARRQQQRAQHTFSASTPNNNIIDLSALASSSSSSSLYKT
jgi:hypothetical protein